jgi:nicotinamidase-related amidase
MIETLAPLDDEIVIPKTASSVFNSTNIDCVLRNLGVRYLILCGVLTDQCVAHGQARHDNTLCAIKGYCR